MQAAAELAETFYELGTAARAGTLTTREIAGGYQALHRSGGRGLTVGHLTNINASWQDAEQKRQRLKMTKRKATALDYRGAKKSKMGLVQPVAMGIPGYTRTVGNYGRYNQKRNEQVVENRFFDTGLFFTVADTAIVPASGQLTLIPQGAGDEERLGRKTIIHSIQIRGTATLAAGASEGRGVSYVYVVQDRQCNGSAAGVTDVLTSNTLNLGMINLSNSNRFRILRRLTFVWNATAGTTGVLTDQIKEIEFWKKLNIPVEFAGATGALTEIKSNNIFLIAGNSGSGLNNLVTIHGTCRLRFSS